MVEEMAFIDVMFNGGGGGHRATTSRHIAFEPNRRRLPGDCTPQHDQNGGAA